MYRQALDEHGLSLEQGTPAVPADSYYYVLLRGEVIGRFRTLAKAQALFGETRKKLNVKAIEAPPISPEEVRQRELDTMSNKRLLWTEEDFVRVSKKTQGKKGARSGG